MVFFCVHIHVNVSLKISLRESDFMYVLPFVFAIDSYVGPDTHIIKADTWVFAIWSTQWVCVYQEVNSQSFGCDWQICYCLLQESLLVMIFSWEKIKRWTGQ